MRRLRPVPAPLAGVLVVTLLCTLGGTALAQQREDGATPRGPFTVPDPGAQLWKDVRGAVSGTSRVGGMDAGVLVDASGEDWRNFRRDKLFRYAGTFLGLMLGMVVLYHLLHGTVRLANGRSGQTLLRWRAWERALHWYTAILFVILAVTGLSILFGRLVVIPLIGKEAFGAWANLAKPAHNYLGLAFIAGIAGMIVAWIKHNFPKWVDVLWFVKGGGLVGKGHPSAGRMNGGEKAWFWFVCSGGLVACVSGVALLFPDLWARSRADVQLVSIVHGASTVLWIGGFFGHAYIGTLGSEGSVEGMVSGRVDVNWAKQHHDLWYADEVARAAASDEEGFQEAVTEVQSRPV